MTNTHDWKESSNQLTYTTELIRGDTHTVGASITCLMTFWLAPNFWSLTWSRHDNDNYDILGIYLVCGPKQQNEHAFSLCPVWWCVGSNRVRKHTNFVSWNHSKAPHIPDEYRDDHRLKMSRPSDWPRVGCTQCHQACDGRNNCLSLTSNPYSRARDADIYFVSAGICHNYFADLITVNKVMT